MSKPTKIEDIIRSKQPRNVRPRKKRGYTLALVKRIEQESGGMIYAQSIFEVRDSDGLALCESTPEGAVPILMTSVAQPVRRASGLVTISGNAGRA